jgi:hypothetical protein
VMLRHSPPMRVRNVTLGTRLPSWLWVMMCLLQKLPAL